MAGIAGIVDRSGGAALAPLLERMLSRMRYEPWFHMHALTGDGWGLGHVWLGKLPGTRSPVRDESGRWHLALDGEVDNLDALLPDLAGLGGDDSQARRLATLAARHGVEALTRAEGNFAMAIWDQRERTAYLLSDRLGLHPLYYTLRGSALLWASKVRPLLEDPALPVEIDPIALGDLLAFEFVLGSKTLIRSVSLLPPATLLTFRDGRAALRRYWRIRYAPAPMAAADAADAFASTLERAVNRAMATPARVGVPLSGGIDSRTLAALIHPAHYPLDTFTFGFPWSQDVRSARLVARRLGAAHHIVWSQAGYLPLWAPQGARNTDGMVSCRHYHICQLLPAMAPRVQLMLDGIGGALYRGVSRLGKHVRASMAGAGGDPQAMVRGEVAAANNTGVRFAELRSLIRGGEGAHCEDAVQASFRDAWDDTADASEDVRDRLDALQLAERVRRFSNHGAFNVRSQLEVRMPFLSAEMLEFHRRIPAAVRWTDELFTGYYRRHQAALGRVIWSSTGRPVLAAPLDVARRRLAGFLSAARRRRVDLTMYADYPAWFRGELQGWVRETLLGPAARSSQWVRPEAVARIVEEHCAGSADRSGAIGALMTFELWCRDILR